MSEITLRKNQDGLPGVRGLLTWPRRTVGVVTGRDGRVPGLLCSLVENSALSGAYILMGIYFLRC